MLGFFSGFLQLKSAYLSDICDFFHNYVAARFFLFPQRQNISKYFIFLVDILKISLVFRCFGLNCMPVARNHA